MTRLLYTGIGAKPWEVIARRSASEYLGAAINTGGLAALDSQVMLVQKIAVKRFKSLNIGHQY